METSFQKWKLANTSQTQPKPVVRFNHFGLQQGEKKLIQWIQVPVKPFASKPEVRSEQLKTELTSKVFLENHKEFTRK